MRVLVAEDDIISRKIMWKILNDFGECDMVINGIEAIDAVMLALDDDKYYDLICLDIMMPKVDGIKVLKTIRDLERQYKVTVSAKIIMTTALNEQEVVEETFRVGSDAYASKPLDIDQFVKVLRKLGLIDG